jgi:cytochrome c biogenesis protein CcmG/thiol:disulfide interchange protein DsbE
MVAVATAAAAPRQPAPATAGPTVTGGKASLAALRGKPVFINVWSSWWSTCQSEAVAYARWVDQQGKAYHFLGLNTDDTNSNARAFLRRYGWKWPSIADPRRTLSRRFGASYQPAVIVVDARGRFVAGFEGRGTPARWNALERKLTSPWRARPQRRGLLLGRLWHPGQARQVSPWERDLMALDHALAAAEAADGEDRLVLLSFLAARSLRLDPHELGAALRRAELLLAAGGDPRRPLDLYGRAVTALAEDLDDPQRRVQILVGLGSLRPLVESERLTGAAGALEQLTEDSELAWQCYAMSLLAEHLSADE